MDYIMFLIKTTGFLHLTPGMVVMWCIGICLIYLAISKNYEPLLLLPIGFGILLANLPLAGLMAPEEGLLWRFYHFGIQWEVIPPLIFLGLGALTDFGPMLARPSLLFLGAGAQAGVYITFFAAQAMGFNIHEAATIGIIGGADGPTTIFLASKLAPQMLGVCAVAAYSYMALVPIIQPPIMRLLTSRKERLIRMEEPREVSKREKILFPIIAFLLCCFLAPAALPLLGMLCFGNVLKEAVVTERLAVAARTSIIDSVTILLGVTVGASTQGDVFLTTKSVGIFFLGALSFCIATACGVLFAKLMNLFLKNKINPLLGAAGVSAVPDSARVVQVVGQREDPTNFLLMHAMAPNISGVIGSAIAAGVLWSFMS